MASHRHTLFMNGPGFGHMLSETVSEGLGFPGMAKLGLKADLVVQAADDNTQARVMSACAFSALRRRGFGSAAKKSGATEL